MSVSRGSWIKKFLAVYKVQRQRLSAAKFRKKCGAALSLNCFMCAANLVNSAASICEMCGKSAANFHDNKLTS